MIQLGKYTIHEVLGSGGFGTVYRATDSNGRVVAVKVLKPGWSGDASAVERFRREAMTAGMLYHPHIATILDLDEAEGRMFLVMRYVDGPALDKVIAERGPLPWAEVQQILTEAASALDFAHQKGFVHRDIKPANILISAAEGAVLTDFGLARAVSSSGLSTSNVLLGTPSYMAPELWEGKTASAQTDVYSLACVAAEMLTGNVLFPGDSPAAIMTKHLMEKPQIPLPALPGMPAGVAQALVQALDKDPTKRFSNASELVQALCASTVAVSAAQPEEKPSVPPAAHVQQAPPALETRKPVEPPQAVQRPVLGGSTRRGQPENAQISSVTNQGAPARPGKRSRTPLFYLSVAGGLVLGAVLIFFAGTALRNLLTSGSQTAGTAPTAIPTLVQGATAVPTLVQAATVTRAPNPGPVVKACLVTDSGGIDDRSFNQTTWQGMERAKSELGADVSFLESQQAEYGKKIQQFVTDRCSLIVASGFLLADATKEAANANPDQKFAITDFSFDPPMQNVMGITFAVDESAFLAGYLAAGMTKTGKIATYGGMQIPTVTIFMDGFAKGADYYNQQNGTRVEVLGWDPATQQGLFAGNFVSPDDGRVMAQTLLSRGVDIIMPVAGPVGLGTAEAVQAQGKAWIIGVDYDWTISAVEYQDIVLTSVIKELDTSAFDVIRAVQHGTFQGGTYVGTLANNGVGLGTIHHSVPEALKDKLLQVRADIIAGKVQVR